MSTSSPHIRHCFLPNLCYLLSEDPYHQSHPIYILWQYLLMLGVSTISATPSDVQHLSRVPECLFAPLCAFCFFAQFSDIVCLGFKQCLRTLAPKSNQTSQDFVHPSNHCIITWLQLTPSQLATSGLVSVECPMGTGHAFLPCHVDLRKVMVGTKGDWHKSSLGKHQEQHLWVQLKSQLLRPAGTMWWGLRWDRNHSWPGDQDNFTILLTACISTSMGSIIPTTNFPQQQKKSG